MKWPCRRFFFEVKCPHSISMRTLTMEERWLMSSLCTYADTISEKWNYCVVTIRLNTFVMNLNLIFDHKSFGA